MDFVCKHCAIPFKKSHRSVYCSAACMAEHFKIMLKGSANPKFGKFKRVKPRTCEVCGTAFVKYGPAKTCSRKCGAVITGAAERIRKIGKRLRPRRKLLVRIRVNHCRECGVHFLWHLNRATCHKCFESKLKPPKPCVVCGKLFKNQPVVKTCSKECDSEWQSIRQRGPRSHLWQGGKASEATLIRGSLSYANWRRQVFGRDGFRCQVCNEVGGCLAAHHIRRFANFPELRTEISNGITLCWSCHYLIRGKEETYEEEFDARVANTSGVLKVA